MSGTEGWNGTQHSARKPSYCNLAFRCNAQQVDLKWSNSVDGHQEGYVLDVSLGLSDADTVFFPGTLG